jgi:ABC-2 type transport system permease protein
MNLIAIVTIYNFEMARFRRTIFQSLVAPIITTSLYFVVFGAAIGSKIESINEVSYGSFIVPGLIMLYLMTESINNAAFGIYFPKFTGSIFEVLSAPVSGIEATIGYVGAAATKSTIIGLMIFFTSNLFVTHDIQHPIFMAIFIILTSVSFSLFGFIIGIWAQNWERLSIIPTLLVTPLVFLGGSFYSIDMLPLFWQKVSLFNPVFYLISGFRWSFFGHSEIPIETSLLAITIFMTLCLFVIGVIFKTGYRLRT